MTDPETRRRFLTLCLLILVNQLGFGLITPVLPLYADSFGLGPSLIGVVIGVYGLARFLVSVPAGRLAELRGRRPTLIAGTLLTTLSSALMATAQNLPQLLLYRVLAGAGAATVILAGQIMVGDLASDHNRGRMMSVYQGFFLIGVGLGPLPGGLLADHFGLRAPFIAYALFSALAGAVALCLIGETRPAKATVHAHGSGIAPATGTRSVLWSTGFVLIAAVAFVQSFARTGALFNVVPLIGSERLGISAAQIGLTLALVNVVNLATVYHAGVLSDRFGRKAVIWPSTLVAGLSMLAFAASGSFAAFLGSALLWGLASGVSGLAPNAYVADIAPAGQRGRVFGAFRACADAGYIVGPLLLGWLVSLAGSVVPLVVTALMFIVCAALFGRVAPESHPRLGSVPAPAARRPLSSAQRGGSREAKAGNSGQWPSARTSEGWYD